MEVTLTHDSVEQALKDPLAQGLLASVSDGVLVIDARDRRILAINRRARELLDYGEDETLGCQCKDMMNSPACSLACPLTALLSGRSEEGELELYYRGREGNRFLHAHTRMLLLRAPDGTPLAGIELFSDLQKVRGLEKALRQRTSLRGIVGRSTAMQSLYEAVEQIAPYNIPVLISGESGVGKERFADAIHYCSPRCDKPLLKINCAALSGELTESELFGHRRGAFTGAIRDRRGYFEEARGGTLLLDEVGELSPRVQAKLLRVLQEGELQRLGEDRIRRVDVRILAATNRSLEQDVAQGRFRQDLYYRLLGARLAIPPLRERREDIPLLAAHFLQKIAQELAGTPALKLAQETNALLLQRSWPGNARELENTLRLAAIRARGDGVIRPRHVPSAVSADLDHDGVWAEESIRPLADLERDAIEQALQRTQGNMAAAARLLGIDRSTLWRKLRRRG